MRVLSRFASARRRGHTGHTASVTSLHPGPRIANANTVFGPRSRSEVLIYVPYRYSNSASIRFSICRR